MKSLRAIEALPPNLPLAVIAQAVKQQFGLVGDYERLVSERDQNFRLTRADGHRFVVKVTSLQESAQTSDFQLGALRHLAGADVEVPSIVYTPAGATHGVVDAREGRHRLRVVTWVDGNSLLEAGIDTSQAARLGAALGRLDTALQGYSFPGDNPVLLWDLQRATELRPLVEFIDDEATRRRVLRVIDDFEAHVESSTLPRQVIHGDANPENVLTTRDGIGFIDFGDMVRAPRIFDVAIAAAYLRSDSDDPLVFLRPFVEAYHATAPLRDDETCLLFDLVRARLATTITLLYWRLRDRSPDDDYRRKSLEVERTASHFLAALDRLGRESFSRQISNLLEAGC